MIKHATTQESSQADRSRRKAYLKEFIPGMVVYVGAVFAVSGFVDTDKPHAWVWTLLPMVPLLWVIRAVARDLRRADEFSRLVQYQGMAVGFGMAMAGALTIAFLGMGGVTTRVAGWVPFGLGMMGWAFTTARLNHGGES